MRSASQSQAVTLLRSWWLSRPERERRLLSLCALVAGVALLIFLAILPAWRSLQAVPARMAAIEAQRQTMQSLANQAQVWQAQPSKSLAQARTQLESTARACFGNQMQWQVQDMLVQVHVQQASSTQLAQCLVQLPIYSAELQRLSTGLWSGSLQLRWPQE